MSAQFGSRSLSSHIPSFMSVFGEEANTQQSAGYSDPNASATRPESVDRAVSSGHISCASPLDQTFPAFHHQQRGSTSTSNSENSADESPTTTISTLDSVSMSDTSPSVSPDSPPSNLSPVSYTSDSLRLRMADTENVFQMSQPSLLGTDAQRPASSGKRARNLKNLAVNTSQTYSLGKAVSTAQFPLGGSLNDPKRERTSAPASPTFIKPPTPPKKRPTNLGLTIKTPALNTNLPTLTIPPTPSFKRPATLRHFQSSPSLPLVTPSLPPAGGMQLPARPRPQTRGFAEIPIEAAEDEDEFNFDVPQSREEKPEAYPDGPIRIYESGIDLYFEPTAEVASQYDVVMNVASEVKNPFLALGQVVALSQPSATVGILSKDSQSKESPTTPKATPLSPDTQSASAPQPELKQPEYIHIPWEHNTDIVPDLHRLVKVIDDRVQQGKRVLVHCQCGVSRSASLIVAYGLYKDPTLSVESAYSAVKKRSKWIGPNMNLIMQLQEFRDGLSRDYQPRNMFAFPRKFSSSINPATQPTYSPNGTITPRTAPVHPGESPQRASTGNMPLTAGLRSPNGVSLGFLDPSFRRSWCAAPANYDPPPPMPIQDISPYVDTKGHVIPIIRSEEKTMSTPPPEIPQRSSKRQPQHFDEPKRQPSQKSVPNFSRQLPLRAERYSEQPVPNKPADEPPMAPVVESLAPASIRQSSQDDGLNLFSPMVTEFPKDLPLPKSVPAPLHVPPVPPLSFSALTSPRSAEFNLTSVSEHRPNNEDTHDMFSPATSHFSSDLHSQISAPLRSTQSSALSAASSDMSGLTSPRSAEFGMIGFSRLGGGGDSFGILSPGTDGFQTDPWAALRSPVDAAAAPPLQRERSQTPVASGRDRRPSTPPALTDASSLGPDTTPSPPATIQFLDTPPRKASTLKTKFSSPNLAEQRRLQRLQTEIEARLPHQSPNLEPLDDAALMSPRAEEFTTNPFHTEPGEEAKDKLLVPSTPEQQEQDPRSPPQLGISPITRNIFDVL